VPNSGKLDLGRGEDNLDERETEGTHGEKAAMNLTESEIPGWRKVRGLWSTSTKRNSLSEGILVKANIMGGRLKTRRRVDFHLKEETGSQETRPEKKRCLPSQEKSELKKRTGGRMCSICKLLPEGKKGIERTPLTKRGPTLQTSKGKHRSSFCVQGNYAYNS